jgi:hypothetical protein
MDEGRQLFLKALQLRFHCKYEEARRAFEKAAQNGSGDACWYIYVTEDIGGPCYIEGEDEKADDYLLQGTKLGHLVCSAVYNTLAVNPWKKMLPAPPSLAAELHWSQTRSEKDTRIFSASEVAIIQKAAEQAILIHDVWPVSAYFSYVVFQEGMMQFVDPCLIAHALCLFEGDEGAEVRFRRNLNPRLYQYRPFDYQNVIEDNYFKLSEETMFVVKCIVGKLLIEQDDQSYLGLKPNRDYIKFYRNQKARVNQLILAWMGCFRRKKLTWLSRDTATLIAKIMANPIYWTKLQDINIDAKKKMAF